MKGAFTMNTKLDRFGEFLIKNLRDQGLDLFEQLKQGKAKSSSLKPLQNKLQEYDDVELSIIKECIKQCLDVGIHDFLYALQENHYLEKDIQVMVNDENIADLSDGLNGELFTEDGWFAKFSKYGD